MNDREKSSNSSSDERHLKAASDKIRKETLPVLGKAYDETGPAAVLALTFMLADIWLESGFTTSEWRDIIAIFDVPRKV